MNKHVKLAALFVAAGALASCAAPIAKKPVIMPAKESGMKGVKSIAVMAFDNQGRNKKGGDVAAHFEGRLSSIAVNGQPQFTVVDRMKMDQVIASQKLDSSHLVDPDSIVKVGKLSGADTLFFGSYDIGKKQSSRYTESRSRCARKEGDKCKDYESYDITCTRYSVTANLTTKAVNAETGQIRYSKPYSSTASSGRCPDSRNSVMTEEQLVNNALSSIFDKIEKDVAPYKIILSIEFMDSDKMRLPSSVIANRDAGIQWAKEGRIDLACRKFRSVIASSQSPANLYNAAVCEELDGNMSKAKTFYKKADEMQFNQNQQYELINKAINRLNGGGVNNKKESFFDTIRTKYDQAKQAVI